MSKLERILDQYGEEKNKYRDFLNAVVNIIENIINPNEFKRLPISFRVKERDSLERKILRQNSMYKDLSEVSDIAGARIITLFADAIGGIKQIIKDEFIVIGIEDKADGMPPDRFGYVSLHMDVKISDERTNLLEYSRFKGMQAEIQIRTLLQHTWAEIEHDLGYTNKTGVPTPYDIRKKFAKMASLLELADEGFVGIKEAVHIYRKDLPEQIDEKPKRVAIDNESISQFMDKNELAQRLDNEIAKLIGAELTSDDRYIDDRVSELIYHKIKNVSILTEMLEKHSDDIIKVAKVILGRNVIAINRGISLLYLGYVLISKYSDEQAIYDYLNKFNLSNPTKRYDFAKKLVAIWN